MNYIDIIILIFLAFGAILGFSRGFTKQLVCFVGMFLVIIFSFILKNPVSVFLYTHLPFFNFGGIFKDLTVINILVYEVIAFFIVFFILLIIYRILLKITNIFEKILKITIILAIPSKLLGALLGIIENAIYVFVVLYILSLPMFSFKEVRNSKVGEVILKNTPILNTICDKSLLIFNEMVDFKNEYKNSSDMKEYNKKVINRMLDNNIITEENLQKLVSQKKVKI